MKVKIEAGAELDVLTSGELRAELDKAAASWRAELARGVTFRRASVNASPSGAGTWQITEPRDSLGPREGFVWALTRLSAFGSAWDQGTDTFSLYTNDVNPSQLVVAEQLVPLLVDVGSVVLNPGETLAIAGTNAAAGQIHVNIAAIELPQSIAWRLI